jgi:hypothetical protein
VAGGPRVLTGARRRGIPGGRRSPIRARRWTRSRPPRSPRPPFHDDGPPWVAEISPRALTGPVNTSRWRERWTYLHEHFGGRPAALLERAAGSEDAFDAAVSALVMDRHRDALSAVRATTDLAEAIEGRIWRPPA